jgi:hypothetical protein
MDDSSAYARCQEAIAALHACHERELATYGEAGLQEVKRMEDEAPAPTPCIDQYNAVVDALLAYGGALEEFELGHFEEALRASLAEGRA